MIDGHETKIGVPQGDTALPYLVILVLEILLMRIKLDDKLIKADILNTPLNYMDILRFNEPRVSNKHKSAPYLFNK